MKNIYIMVLAAVSASFLLFAGSFVYLDKTNHRVFHYTIQARGINIGTLRIDRFVTENKIIYKSVKTVPLESIYTEYRQRVVLDNNYVLENYTKERVEGRNTDIIYLENFKNMISFVSRYASKFSCSENIPARKDIFVFEEDSPVTYLPLIENYNFSRGRSQGFNAISCLQAWNLPPMKRFITLTSINDEHIKIESRKIDAENLILKIRDYPQGSLWVSKADRSLLKLEIPGIGLTVTRTFKPIVLKVKNGEAAPEGYISKGVIFKNGNVELSGTLTLPDKDGKHPAILFSPGTGPMDRGYQGLFSSIAHSMSKSGFATLRFDKTGVGSSGGEYSSSTKSRELGDLEAAFQCLAAQDTVDPSAIIALGHAGGALNVLKLAAKGCKVKGVIMLAPSAYPAPDENAKRDELLRAARRLKWSDDYLGLVISTMQETQYKVSSSDSDWAYILGKKCFLREMREELSGGEINLAAISQVPVLTLQYKDNGGISTDAAESIDKLLAESGNTKHTLTYYAYLGPFLGQSASDGSRRNYYAADKEVLENIRDWSKAALNT